MVLFLQNLWINGTVTTIIGALILLARNAEMQVERKMSLNYEILVVIVLQNNLIFFVEFKFLSYEHIIIIEKKKSGLEVNTAYRFGSLFYKCASPSVYIENLLSLMWL